MLERFVQRENRIFDMLAAFLKAELDFVLIGGYAVSAYKHRFSVDADLVLKDVDLPLFEALLKKNGFTKAVIKELDHPYAPVFVRYEFKDELPVSIDLLVNGVAVRQTNASFSFDTINKDAKPRKIIGTEREIIATVSSREMLIALKLHAGRLTDFRDIVALCKDIDTTVVEALIQRGDMKVVRQHAKVLLELIEKRSFIDSFKGIFAEKKYDIDWKSVRKLATTITKQ